MAGHFINVLFGGFILQYKPAFQFLPVFYFSPFWKGEVFWGVEWSEFLTAAYHLQTFSRKAAAYPAQGP